VHWIRLPAVTHSFDQNQRLNRLNFSQAAGGLNVVTPASANLSPPGHYMLFILNGTGVPSVARIVQLAAADTLPPSTLTVSKDGTGGGSVPSSPPGITCGAACSATLAFGTNVTLPPTPASGARFDHWGGDCTGTGPCTVSLTQARSVSATFTQQFPLTVSKTGSGSGTVVSDPGGISCGSTCG